MTIDPISLKLAEIFLKWGADKVTNKIDKIDFNNPATRAKLDRACEKYIDNYRHRYGKISVLGMPKPAELENIYTNVQIIEGRNLWRYQSQEDEEEAYRNSGKRSFQSDQDKKQDGIGISNKHQYLMVLGQPDAGKSTFFKKIGLAALQGKEARSRHHIQNKLQMADFDDEQIQQFINNWFCREQDLDVAVAESCWQLLNSDGYQATKELAHTPLLLTFLCLVFDESQVFPKNRAALYKDALDILLRRWAAEKRIQRDPIYKDLTIQLEEMLLAKIAYEQFSQGRLFFDKQTVISEIQGYLSENLNAPKHLDGEDILRAIQIQQGILVGRSSDTLSFSHLTLQEYLTAQYIVDRQLIDELVSKHLTDPRWREVFLLVAGLIRNGGDILLGKMAQATREFINTQKLCDLVNWAINTTQDVQSKVNPLNRRYIALSIPRSNTDRISFRHDIDGETHIGYTCTITDINANLYDYKIMIGNFSTDYRAIDRLIELIDCISEIQIFNHLDHLDYMDIKVKIQALKQQMPNDMLSEQDCLKFSEQFLPIWCDFLQVKLDWLKLSYPENNNLDLYFTAYSLIIKCKEAAVYISAQGWTEIEESMVRMIRLDDDW
jgi:hypothetical protein